MHRQNNLNMIHTYKMSVSGMYIGIYTLLRLIHSGADDGRKLCTKPVVAFIDFRVHCRADPRLHGRK